MEGSIFLKSIKKSHFSIECAPDSAQEKATVTFSSGYEYVQPEKVEQLGMSIDSLTSRLIVACDMIDNRLEPYDSVNYVEEEPLPVPEDTEVGIAESPPQESIILLQEDYLDAKEIMITPNCYTFSGWTYSYPLVKDSAYPLADATEIESPTIKQVAQEIFVPPQENYQNIENSLPDATYGENTAIEPTEEKEGVVSQEAYPEADDSLADMARAATIAVEPKSGELDNDDTLENPKMEDDMLNSQKSFERVQQAEPLSRIDRLDIILADLKSLSGTIEACAVVSEDGLIMASNLPAGLEEDSVAAMSAVMLSMGERTAAELDRGTADLLFIRGDAGYVVTTRAGADAVLVVTARLEAKLGLIFLDLNRAAKRIAETLV